MVDEVFDLRPAAIVRDLDLKRPDLPEDGGLRALRPVGQGVHLGGHLPGRRPEAGARTLSAPARPDRDGDGADGPRRPGGPGGAGRPGHPPAVRLRRARTRSDADLRVGSRVRIELHGRRVGAWVVEDHVADTPGVPLRPLAASSGDGPPPGGGGPGRVGGVAVGRAGDVVPRHGVAAPGGPGRLEPAARRPRPPTGPVPPSPGGGSVALVDGVLAGGAPGIASVVRLAPALDAVLVVLELVHRVGPDGCPGAGAVARPGPSQLAARLRRSGLEVALMPDGLGAGRAPGTRVVVGHPGRGLGTPAERSGRRWSWTPTTRRTGRSAHPPGRRWTWWWSAAGGTGVPVALVTPCPPVALTEGPPGGHHQPGGGTAGLARGGGGRPHRGRSAHRAVLRAPGPAAALGPGPARRAGWCASSTGPAGPGCWPAPTAARWPGAPGAGEPWPRTSPVTGCGAGGAGSTRPRGVRRVRRHPPQGPPDRGHPGHRGARRPHRRRGQRGHRVVGPVGPSRPVGGPAGGGDRGGAPPGGPGRRGGLPRHRPAPAGRPLRRRRGDAGPAGPGGPAGRCPGRRRPAAGPDPDPRPRGAAGRGARRSGAPGRARAGRPPDARASRPSGRWPCCGARAARPIARGLAAVAGLTVSSGRRPLAGPGARPRHAVRRAGLGRPGPPSVCGWRSTRPTPEARRRPPSGASRPGGAPYTGAMSAYPSGSTATRC